MQPAPDEGLVDRTLLNRARRAISGIDVLRLDDGCITEVWSVSGGPAGRRFSTD
jgi:hypothetical protein